MRTLWRSLWREPRAPGAPPVGRRDLLLLAAIPLVLLEATLRPDVTHRWAQAALLAAVGQDLSISLGTVKTHVASLMGKLGVRNRVEIALWAYQSGRLRD